MFLWPVSKLALYSILIFVLVEGENVCDGKVVVRSIDGDSNILGFRVVVSGVE